MGRKPCRKETCQPSQNRKGWNVRLLVSDDTVVSVMEQVVNASWRSTGMGLAGARPYICKNLAYNNAGRGVIFSKWLWVLDCRGAAVRGRQGSYCE